MPLTMGEFLIKCGNRLAREYEREEARKNAMASLRRTFRRRGLNPKDYEEDLAALKPLKKIIDFAIGVAGAKNPHAYVQRRFGH